jgi:GT2 family glycosyltransferase
VAVCQPKILDYNKRENFEYAGAAGGYIDKYGYPFCRGRVFSMIESDHGQYNDIVNIFWASGACMFIRSSVWHECGGLDSDFFAHMEEIDLCWRIQSKGYNISFIPNSVVYHVGGGTLKYDSPSKLYYNFRNNLYMLHKNLPEHNFRRYITRRKLLDGLAAIRFLLTFQFKSVSAIWKAHRDYSRNIESLQNKREEILKSSATYPGKMILNKSIVYAFYIGRQRTYSQLSSGK